MIYIKLSNGEEFTFEDEYDLQVKAENAHIVIYHSTIIKSVVCESKYFFPISNVQIFQIKES